MLSPIKSGLAPLAIKNQPQKPAESKVDSSAPSSKVQALKESIQKGEYKLNPSATAEKMALNLLNRG